MRQSRLPGQTGNLFQRIKAMCTAAEKKGVKLYRLSIGQPKGPALLSARQAAAKAIMSDSEAMHEYQDNGSPGCPNFASRFVQAHLKGRANLLGQDVAYLPTLGTKSMLGLVQLACGSSTDDVLVGTMTDPGYPTPAVWARYLDQDHYALPTNPGNEFRFQPDDIQGGTQLIMANYPHNPSGQIATREYWQQLCQYCSDNGIRLFNDAAYAALSHDPESCSLVEVALEFPTLSWAEAFSASKLIGNGTGWRIGAFVGSPDFITDIATIKGETDSGFNAALATGVLFALENDQMGIDEVRSVYSERIDLLYEWLTARGLLLAVRPGAGFFTLWKVPQRAFGQKIRDAEHFNQLMIEQTGVVGVHFHPYIRYAVTGPIEEPEFASAIKAAFEKAEVVYK